MSLSSAHHFWRIRPLHKILLYQNLPAICCVDKINQKAVLFQPNSFNRRQLITYSHLNQITKVTGADYLYEKKEPWMRNLIKKLGWNYFYKGINDNLNSLGKLGFCEHEWDKVRVADNFLLPTDKFKYIGYEMYEGLVKDLDYLLFFKEFEMEDTFFSWFLIVELHIWMFSVRVMHDKEYGKTVRDGMIEGMWADVVERTKNLTLLKSTMSKEVQNLSCEFRAALLNYDEGLQGDDKILAASVWRRFFSKDCTNPLFIERLVNYIRANIAELDKQSDKTLFLEKQITLIKLQDIPIPK